jgi:serine/threonine-protein kinase RsbT
MQANKSERLPLASEQDILIARQAVRRLAIELGFSLVDQTKIVTATSELARNTVTYGGGGTMLAECVLDDNRKGLRLTFADDGPGIPDLDLALKDGWSSGTGLGMGLSGTKRLMNDFAIDSRPGAGTRVTIAKWKHV